MEHERILLDLDTQRDLFGGNGRCYTRRAGKVIPQIRRLFRWARTNDVPVISTVLRVRKDALGPLSNLPHCIEGTEGEQKMRGTLLPARICLGLPVNTDLPRNIFETYQQVIFEMRDTDIFAHARVERLISELTKCTFILFGAGVSRGIVQAAIGLRSRGFGVVLASDAVLALDASLAEMASLRMEAKSVVFAPTKEIITPRPTPRRVRFRKSVQYT